MTITVSATDGQQKSGITKDLPEGKDIPEVYGLGEAGLFDEFFYFMDERRVFLLRLPDFVAGRTPRLFKNRK